MKKSSKKRKKAERVPKRMDMAVAKLALRSGGYGGGKLSETEKKEDF